MTVLWPTPGTTRSLPCGNRATTFCAPAVGVRMSLVRTRKNPITGALVVADVVLQAAATAANGHAAELEREIIGLCRDALPRHKVPTAIRFVSALPVAATGKLVRHDA